MSDCELHKPGVIGCVTELQIAHKSFQPNICVCVCVCVCVQQITSETHKRMVISIYGRALIECVYDREMTLCKISLV